MPPSQATPTRSPVPNLVAPGPCRDHFADDLVARDDAGAPRGEVALGQVQVRAAHTADPDLQQDFAGSRPGIRALGRHEGAAGHGPGMSYLPCSHGRPSCSISRSEAVVRWRVSG